MRKIFKSLNISLITGLILSSSFTNAQEPQNFIEYQSKIVSSNDEAKELGNSWDSDKAQIVYGKIGGQINFWENTFVIDSFFRHSISPLYQEDSVSEINTFYPQQVVARDVLKMHHSNTSNNKKDEILLHQFSFQWGDDEVSFKAGRFPIIFGSGHTINPINPFNHSLGQSNIYGVHQTNDGAQITFKKDPNFKLHLFFLGDKSFTDYDEDITRTVLLRGEWKKSNQTNINYILGEDQKRHKYGVELNHSLSYGLLFLQLVRYSQELENQDADSEGLFHSIAGYEFDINKLWTSKIEIGKFENDDINPLKINTRFLPFEEFFALNNYLMLKDGIDIEFNLVQDTKSSANYYKFSTTYNHSQNLELRIFAAGLGSKPKDDPKYTSQNLTHSEMGLAIRGKF